jgi:hypothetical protein
VHCQVRDGETMFDAPAKLSAQVMVFATGNGRKTDEGDAHSVAMAALHSPDLHEALPTRCASGRACSSPRSRRTTAPLQRRRVNTDVLRNLLDRHSGITVARDADHIITELARIRLGHDDVLPVAPTRPNQIRCHLFVPQTFLGTIEVRHFGVTTTSSSRARVAAT